MLMLLTSFINVFPYLLSRVAANLAALIRKSFAADICASLLAYFLFKTALTILGKASNMKCFVLSSSAPPF